MNDEQLSAEIKRAFGRFRAVPASVEELAADRTRTRRRFGRPALVRLSAGGMALAACLAIAAVVLQPFAPASQPASVFASWRQVPTSPDPAMAAWASSHCGDTHLPLIIQDQRGAASLFVFADGSQWVTCTVWTIDSSLGKGSFSSIGGPSQYSAGGKLELLTESQNWAVGGEGMDAIFGQAPGAATVTVVTADGVEVQASVKDGLFAAWWPVRAFHFPGEREIRSYAADGSRIGEQLLPQSSAAPWTPGGPTPTPADAQSPVPAEG